MSKTRWKFLSLFLICLLTGLMSLFGVPFTHQNLLAQSSKPVTCGDSSDWTDEAINSMVNRYGVNLEFACKGKSFQTDNPIVRADIFEWLAIGLKFNTKEFEDGMQFTSQEIENLQRRYQEIDKQIDIYQERHIINKVPIRGLW